MGVRPHSDRAEGASAEETIDRLERELESARRDLAAQKEHEAQLAQADRLASMGTLAAGIAHEVNSPLGVTVANVGYALEELRRADDAMVVSEGDGVAEMAARLTRARGALLSVSDALREARDGAERVRLLVRDLKTFAGADLEQRGPVDVRRVIESAVNMAYNAIRHRARLVKDYQATAFVDGNEARLGQVFLNLLLNAAEAIPEGDAQHQEIRVVLRADEKGRCLVEVSDTGPGIAPGNLARVFDPFFTTKPACGTGLGLSICHSIVAGMGGEIVADSPPGKGATFRVVLPRSGEDPGVGVPPSQGGAAKSARRGRVLVVDDEPMMGRAVQRLLAGEHDVEATSDPARAVERVRAGERFDVILCDLMMPALSGADVYGAIAAVDADQARRMVFMTGGAFTPRAAQFLESVENPRVEKPLDRAALRAVIRSQLA